MPLDPPIITVPAHILELAQRLATDDNCGTSNPVFCVQECEHMDSAESDNYEWRDDDWNRADDAESAKCDAHEEEYGEEPKGWTKVYWREVWSTATVCLTEKGAKDYLAVNGYNLSRDKPPRIYIESFYRNAEMIALREWLLSLVAK